MATMKQIAERANVSMATVSRVLNKDDNIVVSDQVRNQIFTIAHELRYVPVKQRHLVVEKGFTIGVADWHIIREERINQKLSDFSNIAKQYCKIPVHFSSIRYGRDIAVDGIIALGYFSAEEMAFLKQQSFSILFIGTDRTDYQYDRIMIDYKAGMEDMLRYFMQEKGYPTIGYIGGYYENANVVIGKSRRSTFERLLKQYNIYQPEAFFIGEMTAASGYQMARDAVSRNCLPRALLIGNEEVAEGVLAALQECQRQIPEDYDIVLYRDIETGLTQSSSYPAIQIYTDFMWQYAIQILLERIGGKRNETLTLTFPSKLVIYPACN